eukprot:PhM_4_TR16570/c0_g2_i1/m.106021
MDIRRAWDRFEQELAGRGIQFSDVQDADSQSRGQLLEHLGLGPLERAMVSSHWATLQQQQQQQRHSTPPPPPPVLAAAPKAQAPPSATPNDDADDESHHILNEMRKFLSSGDTTNALTCATGLVDTNPRLLVSFLHEYMPHLSREQVAQLIGISPDVLSRPLLRQQQHQHQHLVYNNNNTTSDDGFFYGTLPATINGVAVRPGEVLTAAALAGQFGLGFVASCNGSMLVLPHCVQPGDVITVQAK